MGYLGADTDNDESKKLLEHYASDIERKFDQDRLDDIKPGKVREIITVVKMVQGNHIAKTIIADIINTCYAAIEYYNNDKYDSYYPRLRAIAAKIRNLMDEI